MISPGPNVRDVITYLGYDGLLCLHYVPKIQGPFQLTDDSMHVNEKFMNNLFGDVQRGIEFPQHVWIEFAQAISKLSWIIILVTKSHLLVYGWLTKFKWPWFTTSPYAKRWIWRKNGHTIDFGSGFGWKNHRLSEARKDRMQERVLLWTSKPDEYFYLRREKIENR